jgi:aryl-alcohol dehydrogenase-like predicted oxidoreductase
MSVNPHSPKLIIGTANFGNLYGIANKMQNSGSKIASEIIHSAIELGLTRFDTARGYGESEAILGKNFDGHRNLSVTTKIGKSECVTAAQLVLSVQSSLSHTKLKKFSAVLLHDSSVLNGEFQNEVKKGLNQILELGLSERIGVSVYTEAEILNSKRSMPELTEFQIPENICDQQKVFSNSLLKLANEGNNISVRSIFLQGLLLMKLSEVPQKLNTAVEIIKKLQEFSELNHISVLDACISYAKSIPWASGIIFGIDSPQQLVKIVSSFSKTSNLDLNHAPKLDDWTLDPRNWS